ncbi:MAG: RidA family protein [Rhodococcus sp. (in: high G+C Gram-positive bacteria)]
MFERSEIPLITAVDKMGGWAPGLRRGPFVYISGVVGSLDGTIVEGGAGPQARQALNNLLGRLEKLGATAQDVVRTRVYVASMDDTAAVAAEHLRVFGEYPPSCGAVVEVAGLYGGALIEIECDALIDDEAPALSAPVTL